MTAPPPGTVDSIRSLYLHIPFCERRCRYCDFVALAGRRQERAYSEALRGELRLLARDLPGITLETVFLGGGTPGYLEPRLLEGLLEEVRRSFRLAAGAEVTLEANPSSTSAERAATWAAAGVNRVSLGVQSLEPDVLRFLGRVHDPGRAVAAVSEVRSAGIDAINCDLIYAVPGLDDARWRRTLERVLDLDPGHISCYELTVEPRTPLDTAVRAGRAPPVDPESALRQHAVAVETLTAAGCAQYEVSNFARPGRECRHNLACWRNGHYLAAGVGAHGCVPRPAAAALGLLDPAAGPAAPDSASAAPGPLDPAAAPVGLPVPAAAQQPLEAVRYWHVRSLPRYLRMASEGRLPLGGHEVLDGAAREAERLMLGLRLSEGVELRAGGAVTELEEAGLLRSAGGRVRTTPRGQELLNEVVARLAAV